MLTAHLMVLSLHINGWFKIADVEHLMRPRLNNIVIKKYGYVYGYKAMVVPTSQPTYVAISSENNNMHFFLHDTQKVRNCIWDGDVSLEQKKQIVYSLVTWFKSTNCSHEYLLYDYEDNSVFDDVIKELDL
jgi:acetylglutamate synthase